MIRAVNTIVEIQFFLEINFKVEFQNVYFYFKLYQKLKKIKISLQIQSK